MKPTALALALALAACAGQQHTTTTPSTTTATANVGTIATTAYRWARRLCSVVNALPAPPDASAPASGGETAPDAGQ
jgi:hypothetical protein